MVATSTYFFDLDPQALRQCMQEWELPAFRANQIIDWVYRRGIHQFERMTNLPKSDQRLLAERLRILDSQIILKQAASDGTQKLLIQWGPHDQGSPATLPVMNSASNLNRPSDRQTECVMIPADDGDHPRRTACISSQIGCPVGCKFCASGLGGLDGNLTAGQMVEQVWLLSQLEAVGRISHVVFMGMGEPLANFEPVVRAVQMLMADWGMGISSRRITISTVGLPAQIRRLADLELPVTLAISLHAPNDQIRRQIIPWAQFVRMEQLLAAGQYYFERTGREVTLEYILLQQINDQPVHARELVQVARQLRANVNLIRYNQVTGLPYERPRDKDVLNFQAILRQAGVNTHLRASRGRDIAAACGQLRHENQSDSAPALNHLSKCGLESNASIDHNRERSIRPRSSIG